jgi:hypothetical protein
MVDICWPVLGISNFFFFRGSNGFYTIPDISAMLIQQQQQQKIHLKSIIKALCALLPSFCYYFSLITKEMVSMWSLN